jgi:hypothetical protein
MAMYGHPVLSSMPVSNTRTMWSESIVAAARASSSKRFRTSSRSSLATMTLSATGAPVPV